MLRVDTLNKTFGEKTVLDQLDLTVPDGTIFGLVGINGAGKSTLLRCISGVYRPDDGVVYIDDCDISTERSVLSGVFYVPDDPYFPKASTIASLKDYYSSFYQLNEEAYKEMLDMFSLDENKTISSFSKGMKRQAMLVFALSIRPKLLLLDEAFDGLDPIVRLKVKNLLSEMMEDRGSSIIISSHSLKELEDICDSFGILDNGKIETYGDLLDSMENVRKYRLAYGQEVSEDLFKDLDVLHSSIEGRFVTLVIRGSKDRVTKVLSETEPLVMDSMNVNFEELFIYEYEGGRKHDR